MAKFTGREYFVMDTEEIAKEMGMPFSTTEKLLKKASINFQIKWKERVGTHATIEDIIPLLRGRGDYEPLQSL
jgi:hypothetical protein